jgi:polar amino acid transport system substrate-binding protein
MRALLVAVVGGLALGTAACGTGSTEASERARAALTTAPTTTPTTAPPPTTTVPCDPPQSPPPLTPLPTGDEAALADAFMKELRDRASQKLVVGVDESTLGLASRDTRTGELEGLEIELAERIAQELYGGAPGDHVQFTTVTTKQKIDFVKRGDVDLSISAITISCERWRDVAFTEGYLHATHAYLARAESGIRDVEGLSGARVCMTQGSTSIKRFDALNEHLSSEGKRPARAVLVDTRNDCHLQLQEGTADAYLGHDTFIAGMMCREGSQLRTFPEGTVSTYGIAIGKDHTYFVRYVNAVLEELRTEGSFPRWPSNEELCR